MKVTYVSSCFDSLVEQVRRLALFSSVAIGVAMTFLPTAVLLCLSVVLLAMAASCVMRSYQIYLHEYMDLASEQRDRVDAWLSKHHHKRQWFMLPAQSLCVMLCVYGLCHQAPALAAHIVQ